MQHIAGSTSSTYESVGQCVVQPRHITSHHSTPHNSMQPRQKGRQTARQPDRETARQTERRHDRQTFSKKKSTLAAVVGVSGWHTRGNGGRHSTHTRQPARQKDSRPDEMDTATHEATLTAPCATHTRPTKQMTDQTKQTPRRTQTEQVEKKGNGPSIHPL